MIPCPECRRFVRTDHRHCPFCDASLARGSALGPAMATAVLGLTLAGCPGDDGGDEGAGTGTTTAMGVAAYAGPEVDTSLDTTPPDDDSTTAAEGSSSGGSGSESSDGGSGSEGSGSGSGDTGSGSGSGGTTTA